MTLAFPADCDTPARRTEYCYRALELLRLLHNAMGKWYREGLTETQWNKLPPKLKARYPYKPQLTNEDWSSFVRLSNELTNKAVAPLLENRELLKQSTAWTIDLNELID